MLQVKVFKLLEKGSEETINAWCKKNYQDIEMRQGPDGKTSGPAFSIFGNTDPVLVIQYDGTGKFSEGYYRQGLEEEIRIRRAKIFQSLQQLEENRAKRSIVPEWEPSRGKHEPKHTQIWTEHKNGVEMTKRDILIQKAELSACKKLLANIADAANGVFADEEKSMTPDEQERAGQKS